MLAQTNGLALFTGTLGTQVLVVADKFSSTMPFIEHTSSCAPSGFFHPVGMVNFHVTATWITHHPIPTTRIGDRGSVKDAHKATRSVNFETAKMRDCATYDRNVLPTAESLGGPLLIEEPSTTTLVHPTQSVVADERDNLVISGWSGA
jgi:Hydantoinase/oxoprolinase C-terminal domain